MSEERRKTWSALVIRPGEADEEDHDLDFWLSVPPDERAEVAWELSVELWALAGGGEPDEPGLPRLVGRVVRP